MTIACRPYNTVHIVQVRAGGMAICAPQGSSTYARKVH